MIKKYINYFFKTNWLKTLYFNLYYFGIKGFLFPVLIGYNVELKLLKGKFLIDNLRPFLVEFGIYCPGNYSSKTVSIFQNDGIIKINGRCKFGVGSKISNHGELYFGKRFNLTANSSIICNDKIIFGDNNLVSWNVEIMDTDFHKIYNEKDNLLNKDSKIYFGNKNWICSGAKILKNCKFSDETIISSNSCISGKVFDESNIIICDNGRIIKKNIKWEL